MKKSTVVVLFILAFCKFDIATIIAQEITHNKESPNIIFIMADDHAAHGLSCYGSDIIKTPNIDRIAKGGMRFNQAVVVNSLCAPSRAALITGKHSQLNGKRNNFDKFDGTQQTFPKALQNAGYQTAIVGKWHLKIKPTGFDYYKVMNGHGTYFDPEFIETRKENHHEEGYLTNLITDSSINWLKNRNKDKPFCLMVHHKAPHGPDIHESKHAQLYKEAQIPEPETIQDNWDSRMPLQTEESAGTKLINISWKQDIYAELKASAPKEKNARTSLIYQQMIKGYMRLIASLDENVGRLLDHIEASGLSENTMIIYTSDNGFFLGDHGMYNKMWIYEESIKVPLLVQWPGVVEPGSVNEDLVSILDFAPTFLEVAGAPKEPVFQGASILPLLKGEKPVDWKTSTYYHFYGGYGVPEHYGIRAKDYKLHHFPNHADGNYWELFDLTKDPHELKNVYSNSNKKLVENLKTQLDQHRQRIGLPPVGIH